MHSILINLILIISLLPCLGSCELNNGIERKDLRQNKDELNKINRCDFSKTNELILSTVIRTGFDHPFPDFINKLRKSDSDFLNYEYIEGDLEIIELDTIKDGRRLKFYFYKTKNRIVIIDKFALSKNTENQLNYSVESDFFDTREMYYVSENCCVKEQYSKGCANISRSDINNSPCTKIIKQYVQFE